jgi:integrase
MKVYKRGAFYHYEFELAGQRHRGSTNLKNKRDAEDIAVALRLQYVKFNAGLAPNPKLIVPTLKALYHAHDPLKLIPSVPTIPLYPKSEDGCERERDYVFTDDAYRAWLLACPEPLRSASILARNCGICRGELLALQTDCVHLLTKADADGLWGEISVKRGLKREARRRTLHINTEMMAVLTTLLEESRCKFVFTALTDPCQPLSVETLGGQARDMKRKCNFHADAGLHALRHTFLTEMGKNVDVFTLKRIAGHSSIATIEKYVHPQKHQIRQAFAINMAVVPQSPQKPHSDFDGMSEIRVSR